MVCVQEKWSNISTDQAVGELNNEQDPVPHLSCRAQGLVQSLPGPGALLAGEAERYWRGAERWFWEGGLTQEVGNKDLSWPH